MRCHKKIGYLRAAMIPVLAGLAGQALSQVREPVLSLAKKEKAPRAAPLPARAHDHGPFAG